MRRCICVSQGQGGDLVALAAALSIAIAQGQTAEQLELLAALFEIIGDNLSLLALKIPSGETYCPNQEEVHSSSELQNRGHCR